jgi:hypothetical protein
MAYVMTTNKLPTRIFVLCNAGYDDDFIFSKSRAARFRIPLQPEPIGYINNHYNSRSYYVYLPIPDSPQLLNYVRKINEPRVQGIYPSWKMMGFSDGPEGGPIPEEKLEWIKKYAEHRLAEVKKGIINPMYPFPDE